MDSWSYDKTVSLANETFPPCENPRAMDGFEHGLSHELENHHDLFMSDLADGFTKVVSSSSCVLPSSLLPMLENQSSSVATQELTRIDFKVRSFLDYDNDDTISKGFALSDKKQRALNPCSHKALCQVHGCNLDLSFSKDYHKRHRVCEVHSKTSVVIVNGIEQRFCQQCSRFHFLSEFDDGKRSCRRRLAGHNERRRKPSFCFLQGKRHKLLRTSQGNKFLENSSVNDFSSSVLPEAFSGGLLYRVKEEHDNRVSRLVSFKDEHDCTMFHESKPAVWDLHEAAPRSTCALSLLSAQSQQHLSEISSTAFSITQPNQSLNHSTISHHQMQPSRTDSVSSLCNGRGSSTVDLMQLSLHLRRIEEQRNCNDEVKQEYNELYFLGS